jgi:hypothetical protein
MLRRVALVRTDVSKELSASSIRVTIIGELGTMLAVTSNRRTLRRNTDTTNWPSPLDFCLWDWTNSEVDISDELLDHVMDGTARIKKRRDALRRAIRNVEWCLLGCYAVWLF